MRAHAAHLSQLTPTRDSVFPAVWVKESLHFVVELAELKMIWSDPSAATPFAVQPAGFVGSDTASLFNTTCSP